MLRIPFQFIHTDKSTLCWLFLRDEHDLFMFPYGLHSTDKRRINNFYEFSHIHNSFLGQIYNKWDPVVLTFFLEQVAAKHNDNKYLVNIEIFYIAERR